MASAADATHWARRTHRGAQATHNVGSEGDLCSRPARAAVRNLIRDCVEVELTVWPVWDQNVLVCGLNSVTAAERLVGDVMLVVGGRQFPFRGHAKASGDVCKGVINIDPNDTSVSLRQKLR
ncbi:hypothetical protein MTO96_036670 [Rhipicephalus appendiculatus]